MYLFNHVISSSSPVSPLSALFCGFVWQLYSCHNPCHTLQITTVVFCSNVGEEILHVWFALSCTQYRKDIAAEADFRRQRA